ncbi:penicillin-binding protein activator [Litoribrevibacter euphylliae]|uniref:Penicillin-binding protein activator n=1 Tax=Litoribrevibacter euphylliae TaxID=1834034 RepID=A0ABV7HLC9_9GAMM
MLLLSACSSTPPKTGATPQLSESYIEQLLNQANQSTPEQATELRLKAARELWDQKRHDESLRITNQITPAQLTNDLHKAQYLFLKSTNLAQLELEESMVWMEQMSSDHLALLNQTDQWLWQRHYAAALILQGDINHAISLLEHQRPLLEELEQQELTHFLWKTLSSQDIKTLAQSLQTSPDKVTEGWLKLALVLHGETADRFKSLALNQWLSNFPNHPANTPLPEEAGQLATTDDTSINRIALLLPLDGRFANVGKAITQGFLMAAYQLNEDIRPDIQIINSLEGSFLNTYNSIEADLIIGPLSPAHIHQLESLPNLPIPTIALNSLSLTEPPVNLFSMNLQAEDEARTMANYATKQGYSKGAILTYDSKKGQKLANTFETAFTNEQRSIAYTQSFEKNWASSLKKLLEIDKSDNRARKLSRLVRSPIEYTARKRDDIEFIYTPLKYKDLRQTNPLMAFFFANDIQVLSNSDVVSRLYSGKRDKDLNGIAFSDYRWQPEMHDTHSLPNKNDPSSKLYSWGADAFSIAIQLPELITMQNQQVQAFGSKVHFDGKSNFIREFPISLVRNGKPYEKTTQQLEIN